MSSEKPKTGMKHPHSESHVPKEKPKKKHVLRNAALGLAAAVGIGGLAAGCAPSARAQDTTPRPRIEMVQSPDARVAPATAPSPPRPEVRVAQATSARTSGYDQAAAGSPLPMPEGRAYEINTSDKQPVVVSAATARTDYLYMFENRLVQSMQTLNEGRTVQAGDWEIQHTGFGFDIIIRNRSLGYEVASTTGAGSKVGLLPFPETEFAKGPMLFVAGDGYTHIFYFNKITGKVGYCLFAYDVFLGQPEVGTDVYNGEPYIVVAAPGSIRNGDISPGTKLFQFVLAVTQRDGDAPAAGTTYNLRE